MKHILLFVVMMCVGVVGVYVYVKIQQTPLENSPLTSSQFSLQHAPSTSLIATITSFSGEVNWQSRIATESVKITAVQPVQQGEALNTGKNGNVAISFPTEGAIILSKNSEIRMIQTLPANIVIAQDLGTVTYAINGTFPFSVRGLGLLLHFASQSAAMVTTTDTKVLVQITQGQMTAAYTDTNDTSTVLSVRAGQNLRYDDPSKTTLVY